MTGEHDLIARYFAPLCSGPNEAPAFGLLDDAALLSPEPGKQLLVTTDALVAGVHFFADDPPFSIAMKALKVNISDIAAKGGWPEYYLLTLALPEELRPDWLSEFAGGLKVAQRSVQCQLIGGDTVRTRGPLTISVTMIGSIATGRIVRRVGAVPGDLVYVSHTIGDAALGLLLRLDDPRITDLPLTEFEKDSLLTSYLRPNPDHLRFSRVLADYASAAMDISDGLVGDFQKLCAASNVGGVIEAARVPLSHSVARVLELQPSLLETVLTGGDDYHILMSVPREKAKAFERLGWGITQIGEITSLDKGVRVLNNDGEAIDLPQGAYDHFSDNRGQ